MSDYLTLGKALAAKRNNLTLFRLAAALLVIYGHASAFYPVTDLSDFILFLIGFDYTGSFGVKFFFMISGLLVTQSYLNDPSVYRFLMRRCMRIFPGLLVCVGLSALLIGSWVTDLSLDRYFSSIDTWTYILRNGSLFYLQWELPGVFTTSETQVVNGSLWSLPIEFICYVGLVVWFLCCYRVSRAGAMALVLAAVLIFSTASELIPRLQRYEVIFEVAACFGIGIIFSLNSQRLPLHITGVITALIAALVGWFTAFKEPIFYAALLYVCLYVSTRPIFLGRLAMKNDPSYGIYIYGFVIQQLIAQFVPFQSAMLNFTISSVIAICVGYVSWYWVEKPAINWAKNRLLASV